MLWASLLHSKLSPWSTHQIIAKFHGVEFSLSKLTLLTRKQLNQLCPPARAHRALQPQAACWPWSWCSATKYNPTTDQEEAQGTRMGLSTSPKSFESYSSVVPCCISVQRLQYTTHQQTSPWAAFFSASSGTLDIFSGPLQCNVFIGTLKYTYMSAFT